MFAFMDNLSGLELLFACCAIFGTTLFVIRMIMMVAGFGDMHSADAGGADGLDGADVDHGGDVHDSTDMSFKLLSLQGITAFFMMFGLIGWAVIRHGDHGVFLPVLLGTIAGLGAVWLIKKLFQMANSLQSSGTMNLNNAIGQEGTVYLTIRAGGSGKVQVTFQDQLSVLDAIADGNQEIKTGESIRVIRVAGRKLVVEKISA
jgi:membrane protein implicated in regulation of membrane protease activity